MARKKSSSLSISGQGKSISDKTTKRASVDVVGIVDSSGPGGGRSGDEKKWTFALSLVCWRISSGPLQNRELILRQKVSDEQMDKLMDAVEADTVVRLKAFVNEAESMGELSKIIGIEDSDAELNERLKVILTPIVLHDEEWGQFVYDRISSFRGVAKWGSKRIKLALDASKVTQAKRALAKISEIWKAQKEWDRRLRECAVANLLELKNDNWCDEDDEGEPIEITPKQFMRRMTLETVVASPKGTFEFWYDDGDLFFGHAIRVTGSLAKGPVDAEFLG